jgi:hypothetical protein
MNAQGLKIAELDENDLSRLHALEEELGTTIVALEPDYPIAELSAEQLAHLQESEQKMGVVLLAYERSPSI